MLFEYDKKKSDANHAKHGIDFEQAQRLWHDCCYTEIKAKTVQEEPRWLVIGMINEKHWVAVIHKRAEYTRIISVRRARKEEIFIYESIRV